MVRRRAVKAAGEVCAGSTSSTGHGGGGSGHDGGGGGSGHWGAGCSEQGDDTAAGQGGGRGQSTAACSRAIALAAACRLLRRSFRAAASCREASLRAAATWPPAGLRRIWSTIAPSLVAMTVRSTKMSTAIINAATTLNHILRSDRVCRELIGKSEWHVVGMYFLTF